MSDRTNLRNFEGPTPGASCRGQSIIADGLAKVAAGADVSETHHDVESQLFASQQESAPPVSDAEIVAAEADVRSLEEEKKSLRRKRKGIKAYVPITESIPFREVGFAYLVKGGLAFIVFTVMLGMIPVMGAATVAESAKIPLFADAHILAALYAAMGMSGAIGLAFLRSRFDLDHTRKRYDILIIVATILAVLNFIIGLAFSAFPPGSEAVAGVGLFDPVPVNEEGWSYPAWGLVLSGAILEICAGGLLSAVVTDFIRPRRVVNVEPSPELIYHDDVLVPQAEARRVDAVLYRDSLKEERAAFDLEMRRDVDHWLSLFDLLAAQVLRARLEALENAQLQLDDYSS